MVENVIREYNLIALTAKATEDIFRAGGNVNQKGGCYLLINLTHLN